MRVTHGCIRLYPEDIEALFESVQVGTPVEFVNQPVKVGWGREGLFMEVHPLLEEDDRDSQDLKILAMELLESTAGDLAAYISEDEIMRVIDERNGRPILLMKKFEG
jgi:L,D-transpeptidase ErfK/SrfK